MLARIILRGSAAGFIAPDDLVHEVLFAEDFVQHQAEFRAHTIVDVQIQRAAFAKELARAGEHSFHPCKKISGLFHRVPISRQGQTRMVGGHLAVKHVSRAKRRVKVDHLHLAAIVLQQAGKRFFRLGKIKLARALRLRAAPMCKKRAYSQILPLLKWSEH